MLPKEYLGWHVWKKLTKKQQEEICDSKAKCDVALAILTYTIPRQRKVDKNKEIIDLLKPVAKTFAKLLID